MRASERSEQLPEFYIIGKTADLHIKIGSHPPLGGRTGAEGGSKRLAEQSEGSDACFLLRRGWGRGAERESAVCCTAKRCSKRTLARPTREPGHHYCAPQGGERSERKRAWVKTRRL